MDVDFRAVLDAMKVTEIFRASLVTLKFRTIFHLSQVIVQVNESLPGLLQLGTILNVVIIDVDSPQCNVIDQRSASCNPVHIPECSAPWLKKRRATTESEPQ